VALATSEDFGTWTKHAGNPVLEAARPHYNADTSTLGRVAFRDPFVFIDDDGSWHMLVCASTAGGDRLRRGCVAHAVSADGLEWTLREPLYAPCHLDDLEVPALLKHDGRYYLFVHELRTPYSFYRVADSLAGPWTAPEYDEPLPPNNFVNRFCEWNGRLLMYTKYQCEADWHRRDPWYQAVIPPKEVHFEPDGTLRLSSFGGWAGAYRGKAVALSPAQLAHFREGPAEWEIGGNRLGGGVHGLLVASAEDRFDDFAADITARCDRGRALGLIFRADDDVESGNWIRLDFERQRVELFRLAPMDTGYRRTMRMQPNMRESFDFRLARGEELRIRLVAAREYVEASVNGRICISAATYARQEGRIGLFLENAEGSFGPAVVQPIRAPASGG
jgi:hypothetical protein